MNEDPSSDDTEITFDDVPLSRRRFAQLATSAGAALTLPGNATSDVGRPELTPIYQYVVNHTPTDYAVPTLIEFSDLTGIEKISAIDAETTTTTEPRPAAYARLTKSQTESVVEFPTAETLSYSPGSNPFWRIGYYPLGIFPEPSRSVDFISFEQMVDGMDLLRERNDDRMNFYSIGDSAGHYNYLSDREDPKDVYVAEVTNDIDDKELFTEKEKVFYSLSIHGNERAGAEAGCRLIEQLFRGEERELESLLDDVVLLFCFSNPDGWVARHPQYDSYGVPGLPLHERGNASGGDTNRQYPNIGWISPTHVPAHPDGEDLRNNEPGIDSDVPDYVREQVPDTLAIVEHFRKYKNLNYGADFHGALFMPEYVLGLASHVQLDNQELHDLYEMNRVIDAQLETEMDRWTTYGDLQETVTGEMNPVGVLPEQAYDYSPSWEAIGYSGTGYFKDWMAGTESFGCLDMTMMTMEGAYSNIVGGNAFNPELVRMQVLGYQTPMRTIAEFALNEVIASVEMDADVAYVETDALTRRSDKLSFLTTNEERTAVERTESATTLEPTGDTAISRGVAPDRDSLTVEPSAENALVRIRLVDPNGTIVREFDPVEQERYVGLPEFTVRDPVPGDWTIELSSYTESVSSVRVRFATVAASGDHPDPLEGLGYRQREYVSNPFDYFADVDRMSTGSFDSVTVDDVKAGALDSYDHAVIIHDEAREDRTYAAALDEFAAEGGNLVLTDTGVNLLGKLSASPLSAVGDEDVSRQTFYVAHIGEKNEDHSLMADVRPIQRLLWNVAPLGYTTDYEAPMNLVAADVWPGEVAGTTDGDVSAGSLDVGDGTVKIIGSLLRPASQSTFHPFGMSSYSVTFFGHLLLTNALGFQQIREVNGEVTKTFGTEGK